MSLANLTTGDWVVFACAVVVALSFIVRMVAKDFEHIWFHVLVLGGLWVTVAILVTP